MNGEEQKGKGQKMKEDMIEEAVSSKLIFNGRVVHLYEDQVKLPNGQIASREYVRHIGAVCVLPLGKDGRVFCVRQFRYPVGEVLTEIPAGKLDSKDENRAEAAMRELREETGFTCGKLTYLGDLFTSPAILDERISAYLAEDLIPGETDPDEDEFLEPVAIPIGELADMIQAGNIPDAKTQLVTMRVLDLLHRRERGNA